MDEEFSAEDEAIYAELAQRAGTIALRLLSESGIPYLDDLGPEEGREVLRTAWREAAAERFPTADLAELNAEIDAMIDSLVMEFKTPVISPERLH